MDWSCRSLNGGNATFPVPLTQREKDVAALIVATEAFLAFFGNLLVLAITTVDSKVRQHKAMSILVSSLAINDIITAVLVMAPSAYSLSHPNGFPLCQPQVCSVHGVFNYWMATTSSITLAMISIDRNISIQKPLLYAAQLYSSRKRVIKMVLLPWTLGIIYSLVPFSLQWMTYQLDNIACDVNWNPEPAYRIYYVALFSLCFFLPALLILIQYSRIIYSIHMLKMRTPSQDGNYRSNSTNGMVKSPSGISLKLLGRRPTTESEDNSTKLVLSVLTLIVVFFVCITPFCVTKLIKVVAGPHKVPNWGDMLSTIIQFSASVINPVVYSLGLKHFQKALMRQGRNLKNKCSMYFYPWCEIF
ncbi:beta-3 adrenergic receptor-like isoform X2 [Varroa jacobsoni]|uniref:G-protein coupled receptors family 1 profile domain-containing protein n=1 Tax=Varroa destructor TaxID=109461 RepID=A0A7M7K0E2_VARDE|nr:beta-3 adrenergic receptor-like [Varroa destructor]XP_022701983.1 beta-3 adrenergic receptor-like isoform X2 [Varroa jacobsoni]